MKCLIKSLNGVVNNPSLKKFDTVMIQLREAGLYNMRLPLCSAKLSSGFFTDSTGVSDYGTEIDPTSDTVYIKTEGPATLELSEYSLASGSLILDVSPNNADYKRSNKVIVDINDITANSNTRLSVLRLGPPETGYTGEGAVLKGDLNSIMPYAEEMSLAGCSGATRRFVADDLIRTYATDANLTKLSLYATPCTINTECLIGKYYMTFYPPTNVIGDFKYFADIKNTYVVMSATAYKKVTGSIEDYILRSFANELEEGYTSRRQLKLRARPTMAITFEGTPINELLPEELPTRVVFTWDNDWPITQEVTMTTE